MSCHWQQDETVCTTRWCKIRNIRVPETLRPLSWLLRCRIERCVIEIDRSARDTELRWHQQMNGKTSATDDGLKLEVFLQQLHCEAWDRACVFTVPCLGWSQKILHAGLYRCVWWWQVVVLSSDVTSRCGSCDSFRTVVQWKFQVHATDSFCRNCRWNVRPNWRASDWQLLNAFPVAILLLSKTYKVTEKNHTDGYKWFHCRTERCLKQDCMAQ